MELIRIFLGGGVKLLEGDGLNNIGYRKNVVDQQISSLNSRSGTSKRFYTVMTFQDFDQEVVSGGQQNLYNKYVRNKAHIAIFILDGNIGEETSGELENALDAFEFKGHPVIYVYGTNLSDDSPLVAQLNKRKLYYQHFNSTEDLAGKIKHDLGSTDCSIRKTLERKRKNWLDRQRKSAAVTVENASSLTRNSFAPYLRRVLAKFFFLILTWIIPCAICITLYINRIKHILDADVEYYSKLDHFVRSVFHNGSFLFYCILSLLLVLAILLMRTSKTVWGKVATILFEVITFGVMLILTWDIVLLNL